MKQQIKNWLIFWVTGWLTMVLIGISYAALSSLTATSWETLTASKWDALVEHAVPSGFVWAFNLSSCPTWWTEYTAAYGRVIRWIDKSGTNIDPDGQRALENTQEDAFQWHHHDVYDNNGYGSANAAYWHQWSATNMWSNYQRNTTPNDWWWKAKEAVTDGSNGTPRTASETRMKNIALLYCIKD